MKRYIIEFGGLDFGDCVAILWTPLDPLERFKTLANACEEAYSGIRYCKIMDCQERSKPIGDPWEFERLTFAGYSYSWRHDGARRMILPRIDDEYDESYCSACRPKETIHILYANDVPVEYTVERSCND